MSPPREDPDERAEVEAAYDEMADEVDDFLDHCMGVPEQGLHASGGREYL